MTTDSEFENIREVTLQSLDGKTTRTWRLSEKKDVCGGMSRVPVGPWVQELKQKNIHLTDSVTCEVDDPEIQILIGHDLWAQLVTGRMTRIKSAPDMIALETVFGWSVGGVLPLRKKESYALSCRTIMMTSATIQQLWSLEAIGIKDPAEVKTQEEENEAAKIQFRETVIRNETGRYEVNLSWKIENPKLPTNKQVAEKRLFTTTKKLKEKGCFEKYDEVIQSWIQEGIVEKVTDEQEKSRCHYLPHHPVFKESRTTPVRPVFDASCKSKGQPSLNDCLYTGPNLNELIVSVLHRFRKNKVGVLADIRKAFLMISIKAEDRDYQRFLWWNPKDREKIQVLRHTRVVFGVTSSPFLLAAVLELHLSNCCGEKRQTAENLLKCMYVDNLGASVSSIQEYEVFKEEATSLLAEAKMDLREWDYGGAGIEVQEK
jgi:hypothetical protein